MKKIQKKVATVAAISSLTAAMTGVLSLTSSPENQVAIAGSQAVKCFGVARAGLNDCGANGHDCSGKAVSDRDPREWVALPKDVCNKLVDSKGHRPLAKSFGDNKEKCYGVAKARHNDCGATVGSVKLHDCAGLSLADGHPAEWVFVPEGTCNKIVDGSTTPPRI